MADTDSSDNLPDLVVPKGSYVVDPVLADDLKKGYAIVACANPTHDPDRMTMYVPSEHTVLSLGAPSPAAAWNTDIGITGYSDSHIHFETKKNHKTIVSLGTSAKTAAIHGHDKKVPSKSKGYAMVTDKLAWHQSTGQHYIISQDGDVSIRSKGTGTRAVVQADFGHVDLNDDEEVTLSSTAVGIGAALSFDVQDTTWAKSWQGKSPTFTFTERVSTVVDCFSALNALTDLLITVIAKERTCKKSGWRELFRGEYAWSDVLSFAGDAWNFKISYAKLLDTLTTVPTPDGGPPAPPGCVKLSAQADIGGLAHEVGFFGLRSATLGSVVATSVSAGLMATLKSALFCSVGGMLTSLKAAKKVEVVAYGGNVTVGAKKNVELTANEQLKGGSDDLTQVTSENQLVMGGKIGTWVGTNEWGVRFGKFDKQKGAGQDEIAFGKASGTEDITKAKIEPRHSVCIDKDKIKITCAKNGVVELSNDQAFMAGPTVDFKAEGKNASLSGGLFKID